MIRLTSLISESAREYSREFLRDVRSFFNTPVVYSAKTVPVTELNCGDTISTTAYDEKHYHIVVGMRKFKTSTVITTVFIQIGRNVFTTRTTTMQNDSKVTIVDDNIAQSMLA